MQTLPILNAGDSVEIIAPASRCSEKNLVELQTLLLSWNLNCIVNKNIFGSDLLCANTDEVRFNLLTNALKNPISKAVICARGGYGSSRLIPHLSKISPPRTAKLFVGMSDITALHLYFEKHWQWPTIHGGLTQEKFSPESIAALKLLLFGYIEQTEHFGLPLNEHAAQSRLIEANLTGGNLCLVQTSVGTVWQINGSQKIIFLEEVGERGYRVDRMLEHLQQANIFKEAVAIVFGDFTEGNEPDGSSLIMPVLKRFAEKCTVPVVQIKNVGHGFVSFPLILGSRAKLQLGSNILLQSFR